MNRIKITEDNIFVNYDGDVVITSFYTSAGKVKQQILQDAEKAERYDKDIPELAKRLEEKKQYCKILEQQIEQALEKAKGFELVKKYWDSIFAYPINNDDLIKWLEITKQNANIVERLRKLDLSNLIKELLEVKPQDVLTSDYILIDSVIDDLFKLKQILEEEKK